VFKEGVADDFIFGGAEGLREPNTARRRFERVRPDRATQNNTANTETRMKLNSTQHRRGFTLVEIMIVVAIVGLVAAIAVPNFIRYREASRRSVCIANLKQMQDAKVQWAFEKNKKGSDSPAEVELIGPNTYLRQKPSCPSGGDDYITTIGTVDVRATCSRGLTEGHTL
jgi:prepilin-type N-terminal cleavage/methylation domain-containing protein